MNRYQNERLPENKNLILHRERYFRDYPVNTNHGPLIQNYLERAERVIQTAMDANSKTFVMGFILTVPTNLTHISHSVISTFIESFKAQLAHNYQMTVKRGSRAHRPDLRYIWAKERDTSLHDHYHVMVFLNGHAYHTAGDITADSGNLASRLLKAWATALRLRQDDVIGCVKMRGDKLINRGDWDEVQNLFFWASYYCKAGTKHYGDSGRSFGCSQR